MKKLILLLLLIPFISFGQNTKKNQKETNFSLDELVIMGTEQRKNKSRKSNDINLSKDESIENENPFLDCDINDSSCFPDLINQHVLDNFNYPALGSYFNVQAMVYVDYTIDINGVVENVSSKAALIGVSFEDVESKNIVSGAFEEAANLIIENLPQMKPSIIDGAVLNKRFRTPILYKLIDIEKGQTKSININKINKGLDFLNNLNQDELLYSEIVGKFPVFPGCEDLEESKKRKCFQEQIQKHIARNFRYPEKAQDGGIQGRVFVQFILGKDGRIRGLSSSGAAPILKQEAERIISLLPLIKPGKINDLRVAAPFSIPIIFKLM